MREGKRERKNVDLVGGEVERGNHNQNILNKNLFSAKQWCLTLLIPATWRQRQVDLWVKGQLCLQSEFQDSKYYTEKLCVKIIFQFKKNFI